MVGNDPGGVRIMDRPSTNARPRGRGPRAATRLAARYAAAAALGAFFLFPVYWTVSASLRSPDELFHFPPVWYPHNLQLRNFFSLFESGDVISIGNSLITAGLSTAISMILGTMCAYSIARFRTGGASLAILIMTHRMIPPVAIAFPVFLIYVFLRWSDTYHGLIILYTAFNLPYVIWMMRGYIEEIPIALEESALVDGCSRWQVLVKVVFPMVRAGLFATAVFAFIFAWNEFVLALVLTNTDIVTFPVHMARFFTNRGALSSGAAAMAVLGTLPVFFAVATLQRYLVRGVTMGALRE